VVSSRLNVYDYRVLLVKSDRLLEQVIDGNLTRLSRLLRIVRFHAHDLKLVPLVAVYLSQGTGRSQRLRFTKSGQAAIEEAYARHFVWPGKGPFETLVRKEATE
jgi:hypothetical protein